MLTASDSVSVSVPGDSALEPLEALIFDMDGVICDTMPFHLRAWADYIAQTPELASARVELLPHMGGKRNHELLQELLDQPTEAEIQRWGAAKEAVYRDLIRDQIVWLPGLVEFLEQVQAAGLKLGLGTSACRENVELLLGHQNLGRFFTAQVIDTDVQQGKPDPQCYLLVAERLGVAPARCLVFEDATAGVIAARRAGMRCWGITTALSAEVLTAVGAEVCLPDFCDPRLALLLPDQVAMA